MKKIQTRLNNIENIQKTNLQQLIRLSPYFILITNLNDLKFEYFALFEYLLLNNVLLIINQLQKQHAKHFFFIITEKLSFDQLGDFHKVVNDYNKLIS